MQAAATRTSGARARPELRATFGRRLSAFAIDNVLYLGSVLILFVIARTVSDGLALAVYYSGVVGQLVYFAGFEGSRSGQTPGKRLLGIRVVDPATGESIGYARALFRALGKNMSALPFGLGFLWMLWDRQAQTWHDKLCVSIVIAASADGAFRLGPSRPAG